MTYFQTKWQWSIFASSIIVILLLTAVWYQTTPPRDFTSEKILEITSGMSAQDIAKEAKEQGIVRSSLILRIILTYCYDPTTIYAGTYLLEKPTTSFGVAKKLADKEIQQNLVRITIPEGSTAKQIASIAKKILTDFNTGIYLQEVADKEGYLFPETYLLPKDFTQEQLLELQLATYQKNIATLQPKIINSPWSEYQVLILASIIEKEANTLESMKTVSSILQNRLAINMPLQADATIAYVIDTPLGKLSEGELATSLRTTNSPYNTYLNTGLPPTPIGNPGLQAITAVLEPADTDYLYYLTAPDGTFHYARTYTQHTQNIAKYLR